MQAKLYTVFILQVFLVSASYVNGLNDRVTWSDFTKYAKRSTSELVADWKPLVLDTFPYGQVSEKCTKSLIRYVNDLQEWKPWAIKMADSTAKFPSGFIVGTNIEFGTFHECLKVSANSNNETESFKGQFCMLSMRSEFMSPLHINTSRGKTYVESFGYPPDWISDTIEEQEGFLSDFGLFLGVCTPSACSPQELHSIVSAFTNSADLKVSISDCQTDEARKWPMTAKVAIFVILCILGACLLGTILDLLDQRDENQTETFSPESGKRKYMKAFSLHTNVGKLFNIPDSTHPLDCLHGVRVLLSLWVILAHAFSYPSRWKQNLFSHAHNLSKVISPSVIVVENALLSMENFFYISGFLLAYMLWRKLEKTDGKLNFSELLLQKLLRYTPTYFIVMIISFAGPVLHNGPLWDSTWEYELGKCRDYGWKNLFYIQNFWKDHTVICWLHTWYIAALIQIQIFSLFLIALTYKYPKVGITIGIGTVIACIIRDYNVWNESGLPFASVVALKSFKISVEMVSKIYIQAYHHYSSHTVGMVLGWYVATNKSNKSISKTNQIICWISYVVFSLLLMFSVRLPTKNNIIASIYISTSPILWSICFSWLVYNCTTPPAGYLNKFLSAKFFVPFSHLSYCVYLMQPIVVVFRDGIVMDRVFMGKFKLLEDALSYTLFTYLVAFVVYITVELPLINVCILWFKKRTSSKTNGDASRIAESNENKDK